MRHLEVAGSNPVCGTTLFSHHTSNDSELADVSGSIKLLCFQCRINIGDIIVEEIEDSYLDNYLHTQLKKHLGKKVRVWAAGRQRNWTGVLLQIGSDFIELGDVWKETISKRKYLFLNQIVTIEPQS